MSLLQLGPTIFGRTPGIITYMRSKGLLAQTKTCARYIFMNSMHAQYKFDYKIGLDVHYQCLRNLEVMCLMA